jgi:hypothetical protein
MNFRKKKKKINQKHKGDQKGRILTSHNSNNK